MIEDVPALLPSTVEIGGMSQSQLLGALRELGVQLNQAAEVLFEDPRFTTLGRRHHVEIAAVSVAGLGFGDGATYERLVARACEAGLLECPLELGAHLRRQFVDQPDSADGRPLTHGRAPPGSITVASSLLDDRDDTPKGFYLRRVEGVLWLRGYRSWRGHVWGPEDVFVFSKRETPRPTLTSRAAEHESPCERAEYGTSAHRGPVRRSPLAAGHRRR